jgi:DNA sulfur modification protein DndB
MVTAKFIEVQQHDREFLLSSLPAGILTKISYASVRGHDDEPGAVQRFLNSRRISAIKDFTLGGGSYPNVVVLNWVNDTPLERNSGYLTVPMIPRAAQLIDGQHRVAGLRAAIEENGEFANLQIPVAIYEHLNTRDCANIFLAINTEQKPVPRSLVFDLYGLAGDQIVDPAAVRARDIVMALHEDSNSVYHDLIKLPGSPRKKGGIALSTAVSAIKPMVEEKGDFQRIGITELESQRQVFFNFFGALADHYGDKWGANDNAFMYASGFVGAIEFLRTRIIPYSTQKKSFQRSFYQSVIDLDAGNLILQEEVKGSGGKDAPKLIFDRLNDAFSPALEDDRDYQM